VAAPVLGGRETLLLLLGVECVLGFERQRIDAPRILVAADARIGVRGHVHQVRRRRRERAQTAGRGHGARRSRAGVGGVDQIVGQAGVLGQLGVRALQVIDHLGDHRQRLAAVDVPPVVGGGDHRGFRPQRQQIGVVGRGLHLRVQAACVGRVERIDLDRVAAAAAAHLAGGGRAAAPR
jgi:hypothetical protein